MYKLLRQSRRSAARLGQLQTAHGAIPTPFFMPIATKAAVKSLTTADLSALGAGVILSNTYHLYLQPGLSVLRRTRGLHAFMNWTGPILTDSGGFQVFSLAKIRRIRKDGVEFQSHIDGSRHTLTPRKVLEIQKVIGSDIAMMLDVCPSSTAERDEIASAVETTSAWAKQARQLQSKILSPHQRLFAIVQGGIDREMRERSAASLVALDCDGYAIGGLAVGESAAEMYGVLDYTVPLLPNDKARYLMGVGTPDNIVEAVRRGIDMFDCVIPTREARHGRLYLWRGSGDVTRRNFYQAVNITNARFVRDIKPVNAKHLPGVTFAYLHHLFKTKEPLALRLATLNNVGFYLDLMTKIRTAIKDKEL